MTAEGIVENAVTFRGVVSEQKLSLKILTDVLLELEKESTAKARRLACSMDYEKLTELARHGIEKNDSDNDPNLVPTKYLFLWGMGMKESSSEEVKKDVRKFQDVLIMTRYLNCTYECWIKKQTRAKSVDFYGESLIGVYEEKSDAEAEKQGSVVWGRKGNWKCWIQRDGVKRAWLSEGGLKGAYKSRHMAEKAAEEGDFLVKGFEDGEEYGVFGDKTLNAYLRWLKDYSKRNPPKEEPSDTSYTVQRRDSLPAIAERFGIDEWYDLYEFNKDTIENPDLIKEGQVINLPKFDHNQKGREMLSKQAVDADEYYVERSYVCPFTKLSITLCDFNGNPIKIDPETPYEMVTDDGELLARGDISRADEISIDLPKGLKVFVYVDGLRYGTKT